MEQRVQCPKCRKIYVAYDTISFRCSQCGSPVVIGVAGKTSSKGLPARELQSKLRQGKKSKPILLLLPLLLGLLLHSVGYFSVFLFLVAIVYFFIEIRSKERIQFWKQAKRCYGPFSFLSVPSWVMACRRRPRSVPIGAPVTLPIIKEHAHGMVE
jgi:hypothetical protein